MTKLANPCHKLDIINRLSTGESSNQIASDFNVSGQRIRQIKKANRQLIEQKTQELIATLPSIVELAEKDIQIGKDLADKLYMIFTTREGLSKEEHRLTTIMTSYKSQVNKLCADILRAVGIFPSQSVSQMIQNIYNDNRVQTVISEKYQKFLDSMAAQDVDEDIFSFED